MEHLASVLLPRILAAIVLCFVFLWLVMRGKWVAWHHPVCAGCGHNLMGLPESSTNCPECGGELAEVRKNAVWRRRWVPLGCATGLTLLCFAMLIPIAIYFVDRLPAAMLMPFRGTREVKGILDNRLMHGELSASQQAVMIGEITKAPAGQDIFVMESLHDRGVLPAPAWRQYAASVTQFNAIARDVIGRGDPLVVRVTAPQILSMDANTLKMESRLHVKLDGNVIAADERWIDGKTIDSWRFRLIKIPEDLLAKLADGEHALDLEVEARAKDGKPETIIAQTVNTYSMAIRLLPAGKSSVEMVPPESDAKKPRQPKGRSLAIQNDWPDFDGNLSAWFPGMWDHHYSYDLFVMQNGKPLLVGQLAVGGQDGDWRLNPDCKLPSGTYDVIFKPSTAAAKRTIGAREIVDWQFTVHGVQIGSNGK